LVKLKDQYFLKIYINNDIGELSIMSKTREALQSELKNDLTAALDKQSSEKELDTILDNYTFEIIGADKTLLLVDIFKKTDVTSKAEDKAFGSADIRGVIASFIGTKGVVRDISSINNIKLTDQEKITEALKECETIKKTVLKELCKDYISLDYVEQGGRSGSQSKLSTLLKTTLIKEDSVLLNDLLKSAVKDKQTALSAETLLANGADPYAKSGPDNTSAFSVVIDGAKEHRATNVTLLGILFDNNPERFKAACSDITPNILYTVNNKMAEFLITKGVSINSKDTTGDTALICAAYYSSSGQLSFLLGNGAEIDLKNNDGSTALINAIRYRSTTSVDILLEHKANVNLQDNSGNTALMLAIRNNDKAVVDKLLAVKGVDVNLQNTDGETALMLAIRNNDKAVVDKLLAVKGVDVNLQNNSQDTALMFAVRKPNKVAVNKLLLKDGVDVNAKDNYGQTALYYAIYYAIRDKNYDIMQSLTEKGAIINNKDLEACKTKDEGMKLIVATFIDPSNTTSLCRLLENVSKKSYPYTDSAKEFIIANIDKIPYDNFKTENTINGETQTPFQFIADLSNTGEGDKFFQQLLKKLRTFIELCHFKITYQILDDLGSKCPAEKYSKTNLELAEST
jgi:ankyrin repeat protein